MTLLPIGRFAQAARLSVKSLRNYDQSGLLPAALVDPHSGYRYYRLEQLARAQAIRALRLVDMPLTEIAAVLDDPAPERALRGHLTALVRRRDEVDRKVLRLERLIGRDVLPAAGAVALMAVPAARAAVHRTPTSATTIFTDIPAGFARVLQVLGRSGAEPAGAPFTIVEQMPDADTPGAIALCVPLGQQGEVGGGDDVHVVELPAVTAAGMVHEGPYDDMGDAYASVARWIHERGHRLAGSPREVYLNSPTDTDELGLRTRILFPLAEDGDGQPD